MPILGLWGTRAARAAIVAGGYVVLASFAPRAAVPEPAPAATPVGGPVVVLREGNERFGRRLRTGAADSTTPRSPLAKDRRPTATVLSCAESRLPAEHIFDAPPGDLFVVRSLGAVVDKAVLATLEYGLDTLHTPLLVVMGHDACDAVRFGAAPDQESESLAFVAKAVRAGRRTVGESADVRAVVLANVEQVINDVLAASPLLRTATAEGRLQVVGAYFDSTSGVVAFSEPVVVAGGTVYH